MSTPINPTSTSEATQIHPDLPRDLTLTSAILDLARLYNVEVSGANYDVRGGSRYLDGIRDAFAAMIGNDDVGEAEMILDDLAMYVADLDDQD